MAFVRAEVEITDTLSVQSDAEISSDPEEVVRLTGGTLRNTANLTSGRALILSESGGTLDASAWEFTWNGSISGTGNLTKSGTSRLNLNGANSFSGQFWLQNGSVYYNSIGSIGEGPSALGNPGDETAGTIKLGNGTNYVFFYYTGPEATTDRPIDLSGTSGSVYIGTSGSDGLTLGGNITASGEGAKTLYLHGQATGGGRNTISGDIADSANGATSLGVSFGSWLLSGNSAYSGNTTVSGSSSSLLLGSNNAIGTGTLVLSGGDISASGGTRTLGNDVQITANSTISGINDLTFTGRLSKSGGSILTVNNTGTTTFGGLSVSDGQSFPYLRINGSGDVVINGIFENGAVGSAGLYYSGSGTLSLLGNNTQSGTMRIESGTVLAGHDNAMGTGVLVLAGGTFGGTDGARSISSNISLSANSSITGGADLSLTGKVFLTASPGDVTLTVENTGTTSFSEIALTHTNTGDRNLVLAGLGDVVVNGIVSDGLGGAGGLKKTSSGDLTLSGANTYSGKTTVQSGALYFDSIGNVGGEASALGTPSSIANGTIALGSGTNSVILDFTGSTNQSSDRVIDLAGTTGGVTLRATGTGDLILGGDVTASGEGAKTLTLYATGNATHEIGGAISDSSNGATSLFKSGTGNWTLTGESTFTGNTTISSGTLYVGSNTALGSGPILLATGRLGASETAVTLSNPVELYGNGTITGAVDLTLAGDLALYAGSRTLSVNNTGLTTLGNIDLTDSSSPRTLTLSNSGEVIVTGSIGASGTGTGNFFKEGSGTLTLRGAATYTGVTRISAGTLVVDHEQGLGTGDLQLWGGTLSNTGSAKSFSNDISVVAASTIGGDSDLTLSGVVSFGSGGLTISSSALVEFSGDVTDSGSVTLNGSGTLRFTADNSDATGNLTISSGTLEVGHDNAFGNRIVGLSGGSLVSYETSHTIANAVNLYGSSSVGGSQNLQVDGTLTNRGSYTLSVNNTGTTTFSAVNLSHTNVGRTLTMETNGETIVTGTIANGGSASGNLVKTGSGTLSLTGDSTYTGQTTVSAGTLRVDGSLASSASTIESGAILTGSGTVDGSVTIAAGATIAPGSSPGSLSVGSMQLLAGGLYLWEINDVDGGAGNDPGWDTIFVEGSVIISATPENPFTIELHSLGLDNNASPDFSQKEC